MIEALLLTCGATTDEGSTALMAASEQNAHGSTTVRLMLKHAANPNLAQQDGISTLMSTARKTGHDEIVMALLEHSAVGTSVDGAGRASSHRASCGERKARSVRAARASAVTASSTALRSTRRASATSKRRAPLGRPREETTPATPWGNWLGRENTKAARRHAQWRTP
jgi:ankyrin repeat protein